MKTDPRNTRRDLPWNLAEYDARMGAFLRGDGEKPRRFVLPVGYSRRHAEQRFQRAWRSRAAGRAA